MPRKHPAKKHTPYTGVSFSCGDKRRYPTEKAVEEAIIIAELQRPSVELSFYQCPDCRGWHLTSAKRP